jgi:hypothetical protein
MLGKMELRRIPRSCLIFPTFPNFHYSNIPFLPPDYWLLTTDYLDMTLNLKLRVDSKKNREVMDEHTG